MLGLLWNLAHRDDCPTDTMDHALNAHLKILDYSCSQVCIYLAVCISQGLIHCLCYSGSLTVFSFTFEAFNRIGLNSFKTNFGEEGRQAFNG